MIDPVKTWAITRHDDEVEATDMQAQPRNSFNLVNSFLSIGNWFFPINKRVQPSYFQQIKGNVASKSSFSYWNEKKNMMFFMVFLFGVNAIIFTERIIYYRNFPMLNFDFPNVFYMLSRANGN